jgi:RNA-directed DNA polymerase
MDDLLSHKAAEKGARYTRYADDLFFSSTVPGVLGDLEREVRASVEGLDLPSGLRINEEKTRHSSKRGQRRVTGVILASDGTLSLGRRTKRQVKSLVFKVDSLTTDERRRLAGLLGYCQMIEPDFVNRLILKYGVQQVMRAQGGGQTS